jgi:hypothetical protein
MIRYSNKTGYRVLCAKWGSVFPASTPPAFFAALLTFVAYLSHEGYFGPDLQLDVSNFEHPVAFQTYAFSLAYLVSTRAKYAMERYQIGIENVQFMVSKWADAYMQLRAFVATEQATCSKEKAVRINQFILQQLHWFSMLSGFAMLTLAEIPPDPDFFNPVRIPPLGVQYMDEVLQHELSGHTPLSRQSKFHLFNKATKNPADAFSGQMRLTVLGSMSMEEIEELRKMPDMLNAIMAWIIESITAAHVSGDVSIPGPILTRLFQELSNGMLGFNQALHIAIVPFPFPFAQLIACSISLLVLSLPVFSTSFAPGYLLAPAMSFIIVFGFWNMNSIAIELEQPFGNDPNDLPIRELHENFVSGLKTIYLSAPRLVNMRKRAEYKENFDLRVANINSDLEHARFGDAYRHIKARFSTQLALECYLLFTVEDLEKKFKATSLAHRMHKKIRDVKKEEDRQEEERKFIAEKDAMDEQMVITLGTFTTTKPSPSKGANTGPGKRPQFQFARNVADFQSLAEALDETTKGKDLVSQVVAVAQTDFVQNAAGKQHEKYSGDLVFSSPDQTLHHRMMEKQ